MPIIGLHSEPTFDVWVDHRTHNPNKVVCLVCGDTWELDGRTMSHDTYVQWTGWHVEVHGFKGTVIVESLGLP
jgi:hypothetical protein